jgi:hypothetical protein
MNGIGIWVVVETKYKGLVTVILIKFWFRKWFKNVWRFIYIKWKWWFILIHLSLEGFGERYPYQIYAGASYSAATIKFNANFA